MLVYCGWDYIFAKKNDAQQPSYTKLIAFYFLFSK